MLDANGGDEALVADSKSRELCTLCLLITRHGRPRLRTKGIEDCSTFNHHSTKGQARKHRFFLNFVGPRRAQQSAIWARANTRVVWTALVTHLHRLRGQVVMSPPPPPVSQANGVELDSGGYSNMNMTYSKSSPQAMRSVPVASSSKPPSTARQAYEPQSQLHADTLARHGIKVRDFAYESKLPPISSWFQRQIQPMPPLKRSNSDREDGGDECHLHDKDPMAAKKTKLERELTEPDIQDSSATALVPKRGRVFTNLLHEDEPDQGSQVSEHSRQHQWPPRFDSPKPCVDTPLVTPNGSFHCSIPASQTGAPTLEPLNPAKLSLHLSKDQTGLSGDLSPMSSLSSLRSDLSPSPLPASKGCKLRAGLRNPRAEKPLRSSPLKSSPSLPGTSKTLPQVSRYYLRKRPTAKSLAQIPSTGRTHFAPRTPHSSSRAPACSVQSSQSRSRSRVSPHKRIAD